MPGVAPATPAVAAAASRSWSCRATEGVEVLPGRLFWAPKDARLADDWARGSGSRGVPGAPVGTRRLHFGLSSISSPDFRGGRYSVPHYPDHGNGDALVGPPAVDQTVRFVYELEKRLAEVESVVLEFSPEDRMMALVLLGAYLVLKEGWSAWDICRVLPLESRRRFPCSWQAPRRGGESVMTVEDCWEGLELAASMGWLQAGSDELTTSLSSSRYWRCVSQYDGSWLAPGKVFVMADPMTVIRDPNPDTYFRLTPMLAQMKAVSSGQLSIPDTPASGDSDKDVKHFETDSTRSGEAEEQEFESEDDLASVHSVCKAFTAKGTGERKWPKASDLATFLRRSGVLGVVRANTGDEPGLKCIGGSYRAAELLHFGLDHLDLAVADVRGAVSPGRDIGRLLGWSFSLGVGSTPEELAEAEGAVAFHCKSGFGRSVVLACCWLVYVYDVPGKALLGWSRIARPGAVTNRRQEKFLKGLKGRADLLRYVQGRPRPHAAMAEGAGACCSVQ